jgi:Domain of unknown function (DUF4845)
MNKERGMSMVGIAFAAVIVVVVVLVCFRLLPTLLEYWEIRNALGQIVNNPELKNASPQAIRAAFDKQAQVDDITSLQGKDIEIQKQGGELALSASYFTRVPLAGSVSLCFDFDITAAK